MGRHRNKRSRYAPPSPPSSSDSEELGDDEDRVPETPQASDGISSTFSMLSDDEADFMITFSTTAKDHEGHDAHFTLPVVGFTRKRLAEHANQLQLTMTSDQQTQFSRLPLELKFRSLLSPTFKTKIRLSKGQADEFDKKLQQQIQPAEAEKK